MPPIGAGKAAWDAAIAGLRRRRLEEEEEQAQARSSPSSQDPYPEVKVEATAAGLGQAKDQGNKKFGSGDVAGAIKQFSKCIWLCESGKVKDVPADKRSDKRSDKVGILGGGRRSGAGAAGAAVERLDGTRG